MNGDYKETKMPSASRSLKNRKPKINNGSWVFSGKQFAAIIVFFTVFMVAGTIYLNRTNAANFSHVCNYSNLCLNRSAGGTANGTNIITYLKTTTNEDFEIRPIGGCNNGLVSASLNCPFNTSAMNTRYNGSVLVELYDLDTRKCVANDNNTSRYGGLEPCGTGTNGYRFVYNSGNYMVNIYWSNNDRTPRWLCSVGSGLQQVEIGTGTGSAGTCQWH